MYKSIIFQLEYYKVPFKLPHHSENDLLLFFALQGAVSSSLTCLQLHKRAERVATLLMERGGLQEGDHVALVYPPGSEIKTYVLVSFGVLI